MRSHWSGHKGPNQTRDAEAMWHSSSTLFAVCRDSLSASLQGLPKSKQRVALNLTWCGTWKGSEIPCVYLTRPFDKRAHRKCLEGGDVKKPSVCQESDLLLSGVKQNNVIHQEKVSESFYVTLSYTSTTCSNYFFLLFWLCTSVVKLLLINSGWLGAPPPYLLHVPACHLMPRLRDEGCRQMNCIADLWNRSGSNWPFFPAFCEQPCSDLMLRETWLCVNVGGKVKGDELRN